MKIPKKSFPNKKIFKHSMGKCCICNENEYSVLDSHRWEKKGSEGGKYSLNNTICVCTSCHRLIHADKIKIIGIFDSTIGTTIIYINKNGQEQIKKI